MKSIAKPALMHPSKANKRITGLSFVRDMGKGRFGQDPRRQVQLLMVLAVPDDIVLPDNKQIVVEGDFNVDGTVHLHLHQSLIVNTSRHDEDDTEHEAWLRKAIVHMRIDQVLTTLNWMI